MVDTFSPVFPRRLYFTALNPFAFMVLYYAVWNGQFQWLWIYASVGIFSDQRASQIEILCKNKNHLKTIERELREQT